VTDRITTTTSRIAETFALLKAEGRTALMPYHTAGFPTLEDSKRIIRALVEAGADMVEIGVPFSDPIADGTAVQGTSQIALDNGTRLPDCIRLVRELRAEGITAPFLLMGYYNPILKYGIERYVADSAEAGVDGFIVPDLPAEESDALREACVRHGRDLIFMVAPTSTDARLAIAAERGSGFLYCVSVTGVTGAREKMSDTLGEYIGRIRRHTDLPLAIGFGISKPEHVRQVGEIADGAIVGAALINALNAGMPFDQFTIEQLAGDLLPAGKVARVEALRRAGHRVLMVGDGINDAPALSAADVGMAIARHGGGIAAESADVVLLTDDPGRVAEAVRLGRRTLSIARLSVLFGLGLSGAAMVIAAFGYLPPAAGALLQEGIDLAVILHALRAAAPARH